MAEQLEGQDPIESTTTTTTNTSPATTEAGGGDGGNGDGGTPKSNADILNQNRIKLYNDIVNLKDPVLSSNIKKIGFKKFSNLLQEDREFQSALLTDLGERNFNITNEQFQGAYVGGRTGYAFDFGADARAARDAAKGSVEPTSEEDSSILGQIKGFAKQYIKDSKEDFNQLANFVKRGWYTGLGGRGAQAENFAMGNVDTENLAKYLKKANEIGTQKIEAEFAKDETFLKDADDLLAILVPSVMESFANMAGAGYQKLIGGTAAGAGVGAATGGLPGAVIGGGKGLQYAMLQQGYNLEFTGTVIDELQTKGLINLQADEATIKKQLDAAFADKKLMAPIYEKANTRALAITGTDFVLSGMGGRVLKNLGKSKAAGKLLNTPVGQMFSQFAEKTVSNPVYRKAARLTNRVAELDKKIAGSKLGKAGATIGVADMFGGAAGETLAQSLTQEELDWKSIAVEAGAEGKFINTLRKLGDIGQKKIQQKAISQFATEKNLPPNKKQAETVADDDWKPITQQEYDDFKKGKITPEKVAGLMDDVDIAMSNPGHLEKVAALDELYGKMVKDVYEMHLSAVENKDLYDLALNNIAELQNKKPEEIKAAITPGSPSFNEKIANDFKNNFNVLKQQYKEKNDSENASGLSSEVGKGQKPQQAQSEQGASEEETGDGGVLEAAAAEERIKEIDEFLSDNDQYFKDHGENILSQEELDDLIQEKETLLKSQGGGAAAPATTQQTGEQNVQVQQGAQSAGGVPPQSASTEVAGGVSETATPEGAVSEQPVVTSEEVVGETVPAPEIGIQGIIRGYKNIAGDKGIGDVRDLLFGENNGTQVIRGMDDNWYAISFSKKGGDGQGIYEQGGSTPRPGHIVTSVKINNPESKESIELAKQQSKEALDKILPTIKEGVIKEAAVLSALKSSASTQTKKTPTTTTTTSTSEKQKPVAKEIKNADVEVRKGKTHDKDGIYEAVYKGKVIGKFSFDKKEKVWVDASGDKFAQKKDAISKFVLRYNMANEAAAETSTTKGEGKGKAATTTTTETKTEKKPEAKTETKGTAKSETKTETKGETKPTGKKETKPQTPKTNPFAETVRKGMEALMGAIGSKVKMNFLSPEEAAKIAAMPEKKRGKLLFQTTAWHGTPHTFPKFKTEKINTGEQAQAFGWGLYFTDDKEIAEYYANELAGLKDNISLEELKNILPPSPNFESLANNLQRNVRVRGINEGVQKFKEEVELLGEDSYTPEELEFVKNLKQEDVQTKNVYKVTLFKGKKRYVTAPIKSSDGKWNVYDSVVWDKIQAMPSSERQGILDNFDKVKPQKRFNSKEEASNWIADNNEYTWLVWDKPVGANAIAKINKALEEKGIPATPKKYFKAGVDGRVANGMTGEEVYRELSKILGDNVKIGGSKEASLFLLENGIDGVKYPAKSVGTGITSDTARDFNYVVFDENAITIEERNGETIPIQVAVGYRGIRGEYRADYNGIQYFAVNERYAKVFGNNIIKASISTDRILDLDKYNKLLESKGLNLGGQSQGFFTIDDSIFDENGNFTDDRMLGRMGRAKSQIGVEEFNKIYDQFVKEFNNADVIYGEDIGNPGEKVYAVKNPDAINTNNVDAAAPEGVQYMKTPDGKILGFVQKLPDGSYNVYINPETQDAETPIHEIAGHIFLPLIKESNPELYNQGTALIQNSEYMGKANGDIAEALALAVGDKGKLLAEKPRKGFMEWLKGMWEWVGDKLRLNPDKIKNLTLGQFTDLIAGSVLKGKELAETKPTEKAETKKEKPAQTTKALPSFSEFDAISEDRSKMKEAKAEFIAKHGQLAYDAMKEISANFTKITKALQEKEILTKKC